MKVRAPSSNDAGQGLTEFIVLLSALSIVGFVFAYLWMGSAHGTNESGGIYKGGTTAITRIADDDNR